MKRILVIEDDDDIALSIAYNLEREGGFAVERVADGERGLAAALARPFDLLLLDLHLPGMSGLELCRRLRREPTTAALPIIMLTARVAEQDKVGGLESGADDYVTKPFSVRELMARVRAALRRAGKMSEAGELLEAGPIVVDVAARLVRVQGQEVTLRRKEFDLLAALMRSAGRVLTRERLLSGVWGYDEPGQTRTVDVHVRHLRQKLGSPASERVETVIGVGYRFREGP